jgi:hypothetical protein
MDKPLKNTRWNPLKSQNCLRQKLCCSEELILAHYKKCNPLVEFFGFRIPPSILGLDIIAFIFFVTFLYQDKKVEQRNRV